MQLRPGMLVKSKAGRDKDHVYVIIRRFTRQGGSGLGTGTLKFQLQEEQICQKLT